MTSPTPTTDAEAPALVVLAAGLSTRYGRLKQLEPLGPDGESIMHYNVYDARRAGFGRLVLVVRPEIADQVEEHVRRVVGDALPIHMAEQTLETGLNGFRPPPERTKPWGTGHAVICASAVVSGPFAVCNADDLYGADAFRKLFDHLTAEPLPSEAALVGFNLSDTLMGEGGVSRGICVLGRERLLDMVTEVRDIQRVEGWIEGRGADGERVELTGSETVSMNLWGFSDPVVRLLERQLRRFLSRWGANVSAEFPLSTALSQQVQLGTVRVSVLEGGDDWFGITHAADRKEAQARLLVRIAEGAYPDRLATAFAREGA